MSLFLTEHIHSIEFSYTAQASVTSWIRTF